MLATRNSEQFNAIADWGTQKLHRAIAIDAAISSYGCDPPDII